MTQGKISKRVCLHSEMDTNAREITRDETSVGEYMHSEEHRVPNLLYCHRA